jgi:hypothetical protein
MSVLGGIEKSCVFYPFLPQTSNIFGDSKRPGI